jgi:hypothetical protein
MLHAFRTYTVTEVRYGILYEVVFVGIPITLVIFNGFAV